MKAQVRMTSRWPRRLFCLAVIGVLFAIGARFFLLWSSPRAGFSEGEVTSLGVSPAPRFVTPTAAQEPVESDPRTNVVTAQATRFVDASPAEMLQQLANSQQPYPLLVYLYQRGRPGDYEVIRHIRAECSLAGQLAHYAKERGLLNGNTLTIPSMQSKGEAPPTSETTPAIHAQRITALQQIEARCTPIGQENNRFDSPNPGDSNGKLLVSLLASDYTEQTANRFNEALKAQGVPVTDYVLRLALIRQHMSEFSTFTSERQFDGLIELVSHAAQMDEAAPGGSLRELAACMAVGACGKKLEELDLSFYDLPPGSPQHAKALEMVPRLRALFRL